MRRSRSCATHDARQSGFTFIWVLLIVAFLGLGLTLGAEVYRTSSQREQEAALLAVGHEFRAALRSYYVMPIQRGNGSPFARYPASLEDLLRDPRFPSTKRHLRQIYVDPVTGRADWALIKIGDRIVGIHSQSDRATLKRSNFDPQDMMLEGREKLSEWTFTYPADMSSTGQVGR